MSKIIINKYLKISEMCGFDIFSGGRVRVLKMISKHMADDEGFWQVATINPEFVMEAKKDKKFKNMLKSTGLNTVDGIGLLWAEEVETRKKKKETGIGKIWTGIKAGIEVLQGKYRDKTASGSELMVDLSRQAAKRGWKVFFLGGFGNTAELACQNIDRMIGGGLNYDISQGRPAVSDIQVFGVIQKYRPKILFVAYGMKKQEEWIYEHRKELEKAGVRIAMGVGRSFDYYSGKLKMAPEWVKKMGLEWLYSLVKEPRRWRRQLALPKFVVQTLKS